MLGIFRNPYERNKLLKTKLDTLQLQCHLENIYNEAYKKQGEKIQNQLVASVENANVRRPTKDKSQWTQEDVRDSVISKLEPYVSNRQNVLAIVSSLIGLNRLNEFDDLFAQFRDQYLVGQSRAIARNVLDWYNKFRVKFFPEPAPAEIPVGEVGGQGISSSHSKIIGGRSSYLDPIQRGMLAQALRQAGHNGI